MRSSSPRPDGGGWLGIALGGCFCIGPRRGDGAEPSAASLPAASARGIPRVQRVVLEMSPKPFTASERRGASAARLPEAFRQWAPLLRHAERWP